MPNYRKIATVASSILAVTAVGGIAASPSLCNKYVKTNASKVFKIDGVHRFNTLHHPQSKYFSELLRVYQNNVCIVFGDNGYGAVDCINEASSNESLPTIVLDGRSGLDLKAIISQYLSTLPLRSATGKFLVSCAKHVKRMTSYEYMSSILKEVGQDEAVEWFKTILLRYPAHRTSKESEKEEDAINRSCCVIWRVSSLSSITEADIQLLNTLHNAFPSVLFTITCNDGPLSIHEEIDSHTLPLYNVPVLGLAALGAEEREEAVAEKKKENEECVEKVALELAEGCWDDAMIMRSEAKKRKKEGLREIDAAVQLRDEKNTQMTQFLSLLYTTIERKQFSADITYLFSFLAGITKDPLVVGQEGIVRMTQNSLDGQISGEFLSQSISTLQSLFFLPTTFSNTTMGPIAVKDFIDRGNSIILQRIVQKPEIRQFLVNSVKRAFVSDESIANEEMRENDAFFLSYIESYNKVKSSNAYTVMHNIFSSGTLRLGLLKPVFCMSGWSELLTHLYVSPHVVTASAYAKFEQDHNKNDVHANIVASQHELMTTKLEFLHYYYSRQLEEEYKILGSIIAEYKKYITDEYSVEDWVQGLIELEDMISEFLIHKDILTRELTSKHVKPSEEEYKERLAFSKMSDEWANDLATKRKALHEKYHIATKEQKANIENNKSWWSW